MVPEQILLMPKHVLLVIVLNFKKFWQVPRISLCTLYRMADCPLNHARCSITRLGSPHACIDHAYAITRQHRWVHKLNGHHIATAQHSYDPFADLHGIAGDGSLQLTRVACIWPRGGHRRRSAAQQAVVVTVRVRFGATLGHHPARCSLQPQAFETRKTVGALAVAWGTAVKTTKNQTTAVRCSSRERGPRAGQNGEASRLSPPQANSHQVA